METVESTDHSFGQRKLKHVGFWVDDVPRAVKTWTKVYGAGPFFDVSSAAPQGQFRGEPVRFAEEAAYGKFGAISIVLSKFIFETPVPELQELLRTGRGASQASFLSYLATDPAAESARLEALGFPMFFYMGNGPVSTYWHDAWDELGHCIEITSDSSEVRLFQAAVDRAADNWDGTEPLRSQLPQELATNFGHILNVR
jgi:hypothetical protein